MHRHGSIQRIAVKKLKDNKLKKKRVFDFFPGSVKKLHQSWQTTPGHFLKRHKGASNALRPLTEVTVRIRHFERSLNKQARNNFSCSFCITVPAPNFVDRQARAKFSK